jgi:hypothetical protein
MSIEGKQTINVGLPNESANSDSLYTAFNKINQNFTSLFACASPYNTFTAGLGINVSANANTGIVSITNQGVTNIVAGDNIVVNQSNGNVTISATGSGNGGGLSSVGISPASTDRLVVTNTPLVTNGNIGIDLANSGVAQGTYNNPTLTVDSYGRIVSAANGNIAGTVTSVGITSGPGIQVGGGPVTTAGNITITNTGVTRINPGSGIVVSSSNGNVTISAASLGGTVTAVGIASDQLVVSGSPIVNSGTINVNLPANASFNNITSNGGIINGNLTVVGNISPAAIGKIGGIQPGPGANISNTGLLTIDTTGLPLSFGNFTANNNVLTIVNNDEDMILQTQGNAEIQLIGNVGFYKPSVLPPVVADRFFQALTDGQIKIVVPNTNPFSGAVQIVGTSPGNIISPAVAGVMLHIAGNDDEFSSIYNDGINNFPNYIGRRLNGTTDIPTQVKAGNIIVRFSGTGYGTTLFPAGAAASMSIVALEDFTDTQQGAQIQFLAAPVGGLTRQLIANIDVANGLTATRFATAGNVVSNNVVTGNIIATGEITSNSATAGVGYRTGAGGTVTQVTDKSTAVTLNTITGEITMSNATLGGDATVSFTLNNSTIANTDVIILNQVSDANIGFYSFNGKCNTGNAVVTVHNMTNNNRSDAIVIRYAVIKAAIT